MQVHVTGQSQEAINTAPGEAWVAIATLLRVNGGDLRILNLKETWRQSQKLLKFTVALNRRQRP